MGNSETKPPSGQNRRLYRHITIAIVLSFPKDGQQIQYGPPIPPPPSSALTGQGYTPNTPSGSSNQPQVDQVDDLPPTYDEVERMKNQIN